jgi:iron(III) transport system substrate-binding protein
VLEARIPSYLQDADNQWFGVSQRARIIFYDKTEVQDPPRTYADLADPRFKGQVCMRSATNVYSQTLLASIIENQGEEAARAWAQGLLDNLAREPQGGDTDQLRAIASGECNIAISNTYYYGRVLRKGDDQITPEQLANIGWVFPDQDGNGTHVNISGAGVAVNAPNRENAVRFLEYLASDQAQQYFSAGNDEYPAVPGVALSPSVAALGLFRADAVPLAEVAQNLDAAVQMYNELGWK